MYAFNYQKVKTVADAAKVLAKDGDAKLLAGGQSLIAAMKLRLAHPSEVVDLGSVKGLSGIKVDSKSVTIGAMTRHAEVAASSDVKKAIPALAALAGGIGDRMVRNMGTIGGSLANNDPAADYPAGVLALNATVVTNKRKIAADEFFKGMYETALGKGEIITSVSFPMPKRAAYMKFKNPASRYAIVGVFVADFGSGVRGEVSGAFIAREALTAFQSLDEPALEVFFTILVREFSLDPEAVGRSADAYRKEPSPGNLLRLQRAVESPRQELFRRLNMAPGAIGVLLE